MSTTPSNDAVMKEPFSERLRHFNWLPILLLVPAILLVIFFLIIPVLRSFGISFFQNLGPASYDSSALTLQNYIRFVTDSYYLGILWRTVKLSIIITAVSLLLGYPVAYYMSRLKGYKQQLYLLIYLAPWLINVVVKAFGWRLLLTPNGYINQFLMAWGIIEKPLSLMFNELGIIIGLVHGHMVFLVMPVFASLTAIDQNLIYAAGNLGANRFQIFKEVIWPMSLPGVVSGCVVVFTMNMAAYATPALLGGASARVMSYLIYELNANTMNWPFGSASSIILVLLTVIITLVSQRLAASGKRKVMLK